jgi:hypothetical protein
MPDPPPAAACLALAVRQWTRNVQLPDDIATAVGAADTDACGCGVGSGTTYSG